MRTDPLNRLPQLRRHLLCWTCGLTMLAIAGHSEAAAQAKGLSGYWRGSGFISPAKGQRERVRCRVWISQSARQSYRVKARCASQAVDIDQTGSVRRTGRNNYTGEFFNSDFNIRGRLRITLRGNRQSVSLQSDAGSGHLTLFRR
mgnify:CR=1 FL=1